MHLLVSDSYPAGEVAIVCTAVAVQDSSVVVEIEGFLVVMHVQFEVAAVVVLATAWVKSYSLEVVFQRILS